MTVRTPAIDPGRAGVKILALQAGAGRPVGDMELEFREWVIEFGNSGYVVIYRVEYDSVILLAVRHQKEAGY